MKSLLSLIAFTVTPAWAACTLTLGQAAVDYGPLSAPAKGQVWQGSERAVPITVRCEAGDTPGFYLAALAGDGPEVTVALADASLDGEPVTLQGQGTEGSLLTAQQPRQPVRTGDTWRAPRPGQVLQLYLMIEARLPAQAWRVREQQVLATELHLTAP